ncbi:hypothetical protein U91I_01794 [alpha proteobacterium U9-1i]|nr:hypothetical protein U91I_01794 [alpha proteobacterium U9-1i]
MRLMKVAAVATLVAAFAAPQLASAQQPAHQHGPAIEGTVLTISAEGKTESAPDMATVNLGVTTEGQTAAAALAANAQRMNALTQALRRAGVAERDIQTANVSVSPQYAYGENTPPRLTGYQASNNVNARVRNIANVGRVIDAAVGAGGNTVNGVSFSHQDPDAQLDAARRDASTEARRRADLYAQSFGMRVHRVIAISESGGYPPPMPYPVMMQARMADGAQSTPIAPGEVETRVNLSVTYELR